MPSSKIRLKQIEPLFLVGRYGPTGSQTGPSDGTYGVFNSADLQDGDLVEDAFDKVVGILDALVPPAAPDLSSVSFDQSGVAGNLSWGTSNAISNYDNHPTIDANQLYSVSGNSQGLLADVNITGTLADNVTTGPGTPFAAYPANSFGNADQGTLNLILDGVTVHSVDLSTFTYGTTTNGNGSGFNLTVATPSLFPTGTSFDNFKYRTGTFIIDNADHVGNYGYKTIQIEHVVGSDTNSTQTHNYAIDNYTPGLTFSGEALSSLVMSGSRFLSGVNYHTSGTCDYDVTVAGVYQNSYSDSASAISHPTTTNCSVPSSAIPAFSVDEYDNVVVNKTATVDSSGVRILNAGLTVNTRITRTVQANQTSSGTSNFSILLDTVTTGDTDTNEPMNTEDYRLENSIESNLNDITGWVSGGSSNYTWDSSQSLVGLDANHNDGLLIYNGALRYPKDAPNSGDFSSIADGPAGNVDYSAASGERVYYRFYYIQSAQNFDMRVTGSSTTFVAATNIGSLTGNQVAIELLAPSQTTNGVTTEWKDCTVSYTTDNAIGCYSSSNGSNVGSISGQAWGLTTGTKSTANSGDVIILKITAPSTWTGNISQININKL
jgi:hypothetical protein